MSDPRGDRLFKHIFHNRPGPLMSLLNSFLPLEHPIVEIEYLPEELHEDSPDGRLSILDVRCHDTRGRQFIVEMQLQQTSFLLHRLVWNAARVLMRQLEKGSRFEALQPVYTLCLLEPHLVSQSTDWVHHYDTRSLTPEAPIMPGLHFTIVELRKWMKKGTFDKRDIRDGWMTFFHKPDTMKDIYTPEEQQEYDEIFQAVKAWDLSRYSYKELCIMDRKVYDYMTHESFVHYYYTEGKKAGMEVGFQQGLEQGLEQGREQGLREGLEQGLEQGRQEGAKEWSRFGAEYGAEYGAVQGFFKAMQLSRLIRDKPDITDEEIARATGLPVDQVQQARSMF